MNVVKEIQQINQAELDNGIHGGMKSSWHDKYRDSAWVYIGGLSFELSEGDILCFMSEWGEIEDINLVRDKTTNKSLGYAFLKYEDQKSTILAVDNFNGIKLLGRVLRCDHVDTYRLPKEVREKEESKLDENPTLDIVLGPGHAYESKDLENEYTVTKGIDLWSKPSSDTSSKDQNKEEEESQKKLSKHEKKHKREKKRKHHRHKYDNDDDNDDGLLDYKADEDQKLKRNASYQQEVGGRRDISLSSEIKTGSILPVSESVHSWRGKRDPALEAALAAEKKRLENADQLGQKRGEFDGIGGLSRIR